MSNKILFTIDGMRNEVVHTITINEQKSNFEWFTRLSVDIYHWDSGQSKSVIGFCFHGRKLIQLRDEIEKCRRQNGEMSLLRAAKFIRSLQKEPSYNLD